ncbi:MAG: hypothetical protein LAN37_08325 [Acidobacteriia bacterium]|nr:hypothetical protein [Terriglobia bacterium]
MASPLPTPEPNHEKRPGPILLRRSRKPASQVHDWKDSLGAHWRWRLPRRRTQWKQVLAAVVVTLATFLFWLLLVEEVLD